MIEFVCGRLLERRDLASLWIDAVEHALDRAVLAGSVHALEDQEQRPAILSIKLFLQLLQAATIGLDDLLAGLLVQPAAGMGVMRLEVERLVAIDTVWLDVGFQSRRRRL